MEKVPKYIAKYHPLYGFERIMIGIGIFLLFQVFFAFFNNISAYSLFRSPVMSALKYLVLYDTLLVLTGYAVLIAFFSKSALFLRVYLIYCALILVRFLFILLIGKYHMVVIYFPFSDLSLVLEGLCLAIAPYLFISKRAEITFAREMNKEDLIIIQDRMKVIQDITNDAKEDQEAESEKPFRQGPKQKLTYIQRIEKDHYPVKQRGHFSDSPFDYIPKHYESDHYAMVEKPGPSKVRKKGKDILEGADKKAKTLKEASIHKMKSGESDLSKAVARSRKPRKFHDHDLTHQEERAKRSGRYPAQFMHGKQKVTDGVRYKPGDKTLRIYIERIKTRTVTPDVTKK